MSKYISPTTAGLEVTFKNYVIELVCMNVSRKRLGERFWKDKTYWGPKWGREIRGMSNLESATELPFDDVLVQLSVIECVRKQNIKSLSAKKTIQKLACAVKAEYNKRVLELESSTVENVATAENTTFSKIGKKTSFSKLLEIERGQKTQD